MPVRPSSDAAGTGSEQHHGPEPKIFLSYAHADQVFVECLAADLRTVGIGVWVDMWELRAGDSLVERIEHGISAVDFVVPVVSRASIGSEWVQRELGMATRRAAVEGRGLVVPALIDDSDLPAAIAGLLHADFTTYAAGFDALLERIYPYGIIRRRVRRMVREVRRIGHMVPRFFDTNIDEAIRTAARAGRRPELHDAPVVRHRELAHSLRVERCVTLG